MVEVAEHERRAADRDRAVEAAGEQLAGVDDVDRAEAQALVDVGFLAERAGREHLDLVAAVGALADLLRGPDRPGVVGLAGLVDVRPFQRGLRLRLSRCAQAGRRDGGRQQEPPGEPLHHRLAPIVAADTRPGLPRPVPGEGAHNWGAPASPSGAAVRPRSPDSGRPRGRPRTRSRGRCARLGRRADPARRRSPRPRPRLAHRHQGAAAAALEDLRGPLGQSVLTTGQPQAMAWISTPAGPRARRRARRRRARHARVRVGREAGQRRRPRRSRARGRAQQGLGTPRACLRRGSPAGPACGSAPPRTPDQRRKPSASARRPTARMTGVRATSGVGRRARQVGRDHRVGDRDERRAGEPA